MHEFLNMGGYGGYVWSSYGIALLVLGANAIWPYVQLRAVKRRIKDSSDEAAL